MTPNEQTQIELAQVFWLPCPCPYCLAISMADHNKLYPLKKPKDDWLGGKICPVFIQHFPIGNADHDREPCKTCGKPLGWLGWLYNDGRDVLTDAIRAKGWAYYITKGDHVRINKEIGDSHPGLCYPSDGLRGMDALELATLRAWRAVG